LQADGGSLSLSPFYRDAAKIQGPPLRGFDFGLQV
jgi:hypothetical protein